MTTTINASTSSGLVTSPDNSGAIALQNNGTTGLLLSSAGRMTVPNQIMVAAGKNNGDVTGAAIIVYNSVSVNTGGAYNSSTGVFTAPVAGKYLVNATACSSATTSLAILIRQNGTVVARIQSSNNAGSATYQSYTISQIVSCALNDTIDFYVPSSSYAIYGGDSTYSYMYITLLG